ncbi:MAG: hypothetical protein P8183_19870, partial [Anaerolineae bacterium]
MPTYQAAAEAYIEGLAAYMETHSVWRRWPTSLATISIGAVDSLADDWLAQRRVTGWQGETGLSLARLVYDAFQTLFGSERWLALAKKGGLPQRPLWSEMMPPDFQYPDTRYLATLALPGTVSSLEPVLWQAYGELKPEPSSFSWDGTAAR